MKKVVKTLVCSGVLLALSITPVYAGQWQINGQGWWYQNDDESYPVDGWQWIDGKCYYFTSEGYCLLNTATPDGYIVDNTGAWTVNGVVQIQQPQPVSVAQNWVGTYIADDGQTIAITAADDNGVQLSFMGYSEEGWSVETEFLNYKNNEKTQVSSAYYYNGNLIEETVYSLSDTGIVVNVFPSGGWKGGTYIRQ